MRSPLAKKTVIIILLAIVLLALGLRVFNVGHVLSWDEAWNVQTVLDGSKHLTSDVWFYNFYRHPPLYTGAGIGLALIGGAGKTGIALGMEVLSLLFALGSVVLVFLCGRDWFDERVGLVAAFLFAVFPAARAFDVFIKPDSATLFFGLLFLLFFFRKKYLLSGVFLGLAFLVKETAIFLLIPVFAYLLLTRKFRETGWLLASSLVAFAISSWWYFAYSVSKGDFINFFIGRGSEAADWKQPWHYYLARVPKDIGWVPLALLAVALVIYVVKPGEDKRMLASAPPGSDPTGAARGGMALFVLLWAGITYLILSFSYGKPPWMVYTAYHAMALLGGWGVIRLVDIFEAKKVAAVAAGLALLLALALSIPVGFGGFMRSADPSFAGWLNEKAMADYINARGGKRVMLTFDDLSPNLLYYLDTYDPRKTVMIPANARPEANSLEDTVFVVGPGTSVPTEEQRVLAVKPDFLVVRARGFAVGGDESQIAAAFQGLAMGKRFGAVTVYDGKDLEAAIKAAGQPR
jgi:4-amino-4-deoxy-L-arabinose transferase-like glycosyltransferase